MQTILLENEQIIKEGPANLLRGVESVGGKLYLTNIRLIFESHAFNIQTGTTILNLSDIVSAEKAWTKFLGFIPLVHNALNVTTNEGNVYSYTVFGSGDWKQKIGK